MNIQNKKTHKMNRIKKRAISMITATAILMASIPMSEISDEIRTLSDTLFSPITASAYQKYNCYDYTTIDDATGYIKIGSWQNLADYSKAYYEASYGTFGEGVSHQNDTILIAIGSDAGNDVDLAGLYEPIGNSREPFRGKIVFAAGSPNTFNLDCPIFGEVYDSVKIVQSDETTPKQINVTRTLDKPGVPLIANKVKSNSGGANWNVQFTMLSTYSTRVVQYGGAIGEIESGASLNLTFANNAVIGNNKVDLKTNATTNDGSGYPVDAGVLCGHLKGTLVATYSGTNYDYSVTSEHGNAGGLVGSMGSGASLTVNSSAYTDSEYSGVNLQREDALVEAQNGYAGGIVGRNSGGTVTINITGSPSTYDVKQFITGSSGAGGIYGYYAPTTGTTNFDVTKFNVDCKVASLTSNAGYVGGIIGEMETAASSTVTFQGAATVTSNNTDHDSKGVISNAYGGLIGKYKAASTSNTLNINSLTAVADNSLETVIYGGAIGKIDSGSYVNFDTFTLTSADGNLAGTFGGIAADAEGAYIYAKDVTIGSTLEGGTASISEFTGGGLVGKLGNGVLGMTGAIDVSKASPTAADANGQIVGSRDNALIYAENIAATETEVASSWSYTPNSSKVDNIGSWGDVLVIDGTALSRSDLFASETNHIISLNTVNPSAINSVASYALVSLQFQIDPSKNSFMTGYTQLAENVGLSFTDDIVLTNTGLRGITRDNGSSRVTYKGNASATSGKKITLDFKNIGGSDRPVYRHKYLGLFGIADGSTFTNMALNGTILDANVRAASNDTTSYVGALTAQAKTSLTVTSCSTADTLNISLENSTNAVTAGRLIGGAVSPMGDITITGSTFDGTINGKSVVGGVIGKIGGASSRANWTFENVTLKGTVTGVKSVGGLVSEVSGGNTATIKLKGTTGVVTNGLKINGNSNDSMGGLLGYSWDNTDVEVTKVSVSNTPVITQSSTGGVAGLVYQATGHWEITSLDLTGIKMAAGSAGSVGMIVNKGTNGSNGIYLVLPSGYDYKLSFAEGSSIAASVTANKFDEICAFSATNGAVMTNGQGIVSISSAGGLVMSTTAADSLTYKPRTTQGQTANPNSRYYYNLDTIDRDNTVTSSAPEKQLMRWGLNQYAANNIKTYFPDPFTTTTDGVTISEISAGTYNMSGYSWYPVNPNYAVTVDGTFTFYNKEYEGCETASGSATNGVAWSSLTGTQHYMMQNGLFYNVNHNVTIGAVTLSGNIGAVNEDGTGALVYGTVEGSSSKTEDIVTLDSTSGSISLAGIYVWNLSSQSGYAPLLINKASKDVTLNISNVSNTGAYTTNGIASAATSLIGKAGCNDDSEFINVSFTNIKLDGRDPAIETKPTITVDYNTNASLFTRATLLESLHYTTGGSGTYIYSYDNDWGSGGHNVTYGKEVGYTTTSNSTTQYPSEEQWYAGEKHDGTGHSVHPTSSSDTSCAYAATFVSSFLPYVKTVSTKTNLETEMNYQLMVNHAASDTLDGCGTYNDPYIIKTGDHLEKLSYFVRTGTFSDGDTFNIPKSGVSSTWCTYKTVDGKDEYDHYTYKYQSGSFKRTDNTSNTLSADDVRTYLAGAYYKIDNNATTSDLTIDNDANIGGFQGLGMSTDKYRFRGVIIGSNKTITNTTKYPLIAYSNGSVVKDLKVNVNKSFEIEGSSGTYESQNRVYGAIFGQINGGDNIIDHVEVTYGSSVITVKGDKAQDVTVGGYVGVVINGGLIFKNMSGNISGLATNNVKANVSNTDITGILASNNNRWLFVNPIIGRVINGFAVTEGTAYVPGESSVTMKNSTGDHDVVKNYSIADIKDYTSLESEAAEYYAENGEVLVNKLDVKGASGSKIVVPDAQAFFIMSLMVNSGMSTFLAIDNKNWDSVNSSAGCLGYYKTNGYFTTRNAEYSDVGSKIAQGTDYTNSTKDLSWNKGNDAAKQQACTYLIWHYSIPYDGKYYARAISHSSNSYTVELTGTNDYILPDGFRGVGNFFKNTDALRLQITDFDGNDNNIIQNTKYYYYNSENAYISSSGDTLPVNHANSGLGLFNNQPTANAIYHDFTVKGNVNSMVINKTDASGAHIAYDTSTNNTNTILSVGGLFGTANVSTTINNVNLVDIDVRSSRNAGGMIGMSVGTTNITINNNADSSNITVIGGQTTGGLIGQKNQNQNETGNIVIDFNAHYFKIKKIEGTSTVAFSGNNANRGGVGGLIGACRANNSSGTNYTLSISGVKMTNYSENTFGIITADKFNVGGIIGSPNRAPITVSNCEISNINCTANGTVGGITGYLSTKSPATITSCQIKNTISGKTPEISGTNSTGSGGFFGSTGGTEVGAVTIENSSIEGYIISAKTNAGGIIGNRTSSSRYTDAHMTLKNIKVKDCIIRADTNVAGLVGSIDFYSLLGYNILTDNLTFTKQNGSTTGISTLGYIVGNLNTSSTYPSSVKLVAFSRQNVQTVGSDKLVGSSSGDTDTNLFGANGYVIFADYKGVVSNTSWTSDVAVTTSGKTRVTAASPYITVNPKTEIDAASTPKYLTSDGANLSAITQIMADIENTTHPAGYYDIASSVESSLSNKVSSFVDEMGTKPISIGGRDFPVLIVDDINEVNTTKRINDYIALLTNNASGNFNYASTADSSVFKTVIHRCTFNNTGTEVTIGAGQTADYSTVSAADNSYPCLKRSSTQFFMYANDTDSKEENAQFTLIDIQYLDPSGSGKIVYHLYVPVYVRKVLQYDFNIHVESGTTYKVNTPANIIKNTLLENIGTPVTLEFAFTYDRDADEWKTAVNGGDSLLTNYPKKLKFDNSTEADGTKPNLPVGTKMVLIDSQDYSKPYYLDDIYASMEDGDPAFRGSDSEKYLYLNGFTDGSESFSPKNFNDLMVVTIVADDNGTLVNATEHPKDGYPAIVTDNSGGANNGSSFRYYAGDTGFTRYSVSSITFKNAGTKLVEHYFVSIYTPYTDADTVFHYSISAGKDLGTDPYPSRVTKVSENNAVNLFMGNIYDQEIRINSQKVGGVEGKQIISSSGNDNQLTADLTAKVSLTQSAKDNGIKTYLGDPTTAPDIYESLLIQFNKHTPTVNDIGIKGVEDVDVSTYTINGTPIRTLNTSWSKSDNVITNLSFIELSNDYPLARTLYNSDTVTINAVATVTFNKETGISQQFYPETPDNRRTNLIALSKISSDSSTVAYSKVSVQTSKIWDPDEEEESEDIYQYYTEDTEEAIITHEALEMSDGQLPQLGINANDPNDLKKLPSPIHTIGTYDVEKCPTSWENAEYIVCELELKTIDSNYTSALPIFKYIEPSSFKILDGFTPTSIVYLDGSGNTVTPTVVDEETVLPITTHTIRVTYTKAALSSKLDEDIYQIPIEFKVYSGSAFEDESLTYANFGLYLYVYMLDSSENTITVTTTPSGGDYVKYTNARIYLEKVDPSKAS